MEEKVDILLKEIQKTARKLKELKKENLALKAENGFFRKENDKNSVKLREYNELKKKTEETVVKIERILKKIDTVKA